MSFFSVPHPVYLMVQKREIFSVTHQAAKDVHIEQILSHIRATSRAVGFVPGPKAVSCGQSGRVDGTKHSGLCRNSPFCGAILLRNRTSAFLWKGMQEGMLFPLRRKFQSF